MGLRFRRSIKLIPGVRVNLSKSGTSVSLGGKGMTRNIGPKGSRTTYSVPGAGLSQVDYHGRRRRRRSTVAAAPAATGPVTPWTVIQMVFSLIFLGALGGLIVFGTVALIYGVPAAWTVIKVLGGGVILICLVLLWAWRLDVRDRQRAKKPG